MTVTLGSELREVLEGLYWGGTTTKEGGLTGDETARERAESDLSSDLLARPIGQMPAEASRQKTG